MSSAFAVNYDSLICIWSETGVLRRKITAHGGAPVWSIDISPDRSTLITGGGDGGLNTWSLSNSSPILSHRFTYQKKTPKFVTYMHSGALAVFMDGGDLLYYNQTHQHSPPTTMIVLRRLSSYCLMHISPDRKKLAFASQDGHVIIFQEELTGEKNHPSLQEVLDQKIIDSKIFSLQWLSGASLLVCGPRGALKLLNFKGNHLEIQAEFTLPLSKECWTTSALICSSLLVCGDRTGNIIVYRVNPSPSKMPRQILQRIHGRLGVQSLGISGDKILSTGRDGTLRYHRLLEDDSGEHLEPLHWKKMPMEWVSRSLRTDDDVYVLGFKEIEFMIYSTRLERLLLRMICGGGHRSWDCLFNDGEINFVCIKDKQVHTTENLSIKSSNSIIPGLHSKEIHSLGVLGTSSRHRVILTGSEDCSIRVSVLERRSRGFEIVPLDVYDGHISSIKTIEILDLNLNSCEETEILSRSLVFSGGGRAQLKVWEVRVDFTKEIITRDDVVGMQLTSFMLRGTDRDRRKFPNSGTSYFLDPETRFMDISAQFCRWDKNIVILFVACSDGFIRVIFYDVEKKIASLLVEISYYNRCVLKVHSFEIEGGMILVSMATDGFINLWDGDFIVRGALEDGTAGEGLEPFGRWRAHQSGINSYDFREDGTVFFIVSGGDDNKVSFSVFEVFGDCQKREVRTKGFWESSDTHSAQITGARFIPNDQLLTTAIDQRVVLYDYNYSNEKLSVAPIKIIQTFVSDLQGLTVCHNPENCDETLAFVYGQGVEVLLHEHKAYN
ncbi:WD repeat-containing protein 6 [Fopius arisanus]|uniref:tRNA (34-2'-O)-methyltransferase regulator WDR6 n=1 Tax=Fopius arisanus TaxID=64838 RepID=A0A9R1U6E3_9HYME|nr:PREDICTED: WD repeat-containing protein 6 [Fopius arisanus]